MPIILMMDLIEDPLVYKVTPVKRYFEVTRQQLDPSISVVLHLTHDKFSGCLTVSSGVQVSLHVPTGKSLYNYVVTALRGIVRC
jgi:hypothetical protein